MMAFGFGNVTNTGIHPEPLKANSTVTQIKQNEEEVIKSFKALTALHSSECDTIVPKIMTMG